jgi:DNA-binding beta-propeller fold protein YncE
MRSFLTITFGAAGIRLGGNNLKRRLGVLCALWMTVILGAQAQTNPPLKQIQSIPMPNVEGYFDHPAVDIKGQRLFVPGEHQRTIEIIDLRAGKDIHSITGLEGNPRKIVYIPESNQIWVDLGSGVAKSFDAGTYEPLKTVQLNPTSTPEEKREPDNGILDKATGLFYIGDRGDRSKEGTKGSLEIVDTKQGTYAGSITLEDNDPAGLALDTSNSKLYVVLGATSRVAVIDRQKREVVAMWPISPDAPLPHALGFDQAHHRLFIGSRVKKGHIYKPGKMVVMNSDNGNIVQVLDSEGGVDEVQYEPASKRVYFTGTTGYVDVFKQTDPDHYERLGLVPTSVIAKTSILVPELKRFYAIVPKHIVLTPPVPESAEKAVEDARVLVYEVEP